MSSASAPRETGGDAAVVAALRAGDEKAFEAVVRRYYPTMKRVARAYVSTDAVAEEVVQEAWESVLRGLDGFEGRCALKSWIFQVLVNRARTRGWRERRSVPFSALDGGGRGGADVEVLRGARDTSSDAWRAPSRPWTDPQRRLLSLEVRAALRTALDRLPERQRTVVCLRDVENLDYATVSRLLGISDANQRVLLHRGRAHLRHALDAALAGDA